MNRRAFNSGIIALLAAPLGTEAQQAGRVARIGFIGDSPGGPFIQAFEQELRKLGYIVGENIAIAYRSAEGKDERLPRLAAELVRLKVDVLVVALTQRKRIADLALRNRLPSTFQTSEHAEAGGLMSYAPKFGCPLSQRRRLRGQDPERRQTRRPPHRAAHPIRAGHQPQNGEGTGPHDPAVAAAAGGSGHRVAAARTTPESFALWVQFARDRRLAEDRDCAKASHGGSGHDDRTRCARSCPSPQPPCRAARRARAAAGEDLPRRVARRRSLG